MKIVTLTLEDEELIAAIESEAKEIGVSEEDMVIQALQFWLLESEMDCEEKSRLNAARAEMEKGDGVEAHEFFNGLRAEELAAASR